MTWLGVSPAVLLSTDRELARGNDPRGHKHCCPNVTLVSDIVHVRIARDPKSFWCESRHGGLLHRCRRCDYSPRPFRHVAGALLNTHYALQLTGNDSCVRKGTTRS